MLEVLLSLPTMPTFFKMFWNPIKYKNPWTSGKVLRPNTFLNVIYFRHPSPIPSTPRNWNTTSSVPGQLPTTELSVMDSSALCIHLDCLECIHAVLIGINLMKGVFWKPIDGGIALRYIPSILRSSSTTHSKRLYEEGYINGQFHKHVTSESGFLLLLHTIKRIGWGNV